MRFRFARGCLAFAPSEEEKDVSCSTLCWESSDVSWSSVWLGPGDVDAGGEAVGDIMEEGVGRDVAVV